MTPLRRFAAVLLLLFGFGISGAPASAQTFVITGVAFDESAYLDRRVLDEVAAGYVGRPIGFQDLQALISEVQALYAAAGVITARALLPPQEIRDGILRVALVEAVIGEVRVEGVEQTNPEFLQSKITLPVGSLPDFERLERDLRVFDIAHDIAPRLAFEPGARPGTTIAVISADEPKRVQWTASLDNFGREESGLYRASLFMRWNSVSGVRDALSAQLQITQGSQALSLGYSRPVGRGGGRVIVAGSYSRSNIIAGGFAPINVVANSAGASLTFRTPVRVRANSHWLIDAAVAYEQNTSTTTGLAFFDMRITDATVSASYALRRPQALWSFTAGVKGGNADSGGTSQTEGSFALVFGNVAHTRQLGSRLVLEADAQFQFAPDQNLPVARLISAGGPSVMRGYPANVRAGDSGVIVRLQLSAAEGFSFGNEGRIRARPFGFLDAGLIVPFRPGGGIVADQDVLYSAGAGVRVNFRDQASALLMAAVPLKDTVGFTASGTPTFYFGLDYRF